MGALFTIDQITLPVVDIAHFIHRDGTVISPDLCRDAGLRHGANSVTLRMIEIILAFRALLGVDHIGLVLKRDRCVRAFEFASSADCALRSDDFIGHDSAPLNE